MLWRNKYLKLCIESFDIIYKKSNLDNVMPFLILLVALFIFTLVRGEHNVAIGTCMLIVVALLATYNKTFKESLREFF